MSEGIRFERRKDGVAVVLFDTPGSKVNVLSKELANELDPILTAIETDESIRAVVIGSAKPDGFLAGANLEQVLAMKTHGEGEAFSRAGQALLNRVAGSAKPFVAAIHGAALGGGLEVALACHYRLASDHGKTVLGQPEVQLGLLPAAGGTQRLPRLVGLARALPMLLTGERLRGERALRAGLVDALTSPGGLVETAARAARLLADGRLTPRRRKAPLAERLLALAPLRSLALKRARAEVLAKTHGLYPAPLDILACVEEGLARGMAAGLEKEAVLFGKLVASEEAKNLIRLFDSMTALKKLPALPTPRPVRRVAVLGAGLMGEGIASVSLPLNPVVLKDVAPAALAKAAKGIVRGLDRRLRSGALTRLERDRQRFTLRPAAGPDAAAGADLVIEAVFEDLDLKRRVLAETERVIAPEAVYASNTSALPIRAIAEEAAHPERVVGMHYFSPVPKMPLLEVVVSEKTADWAAVTAQAYGIAQGKTVILVRDGPGFYTTRILAPYINEAILLLEEGAEIRALDEALVRFGFPVGPVTLLDEVGIDIAAHVSKDLGAASGSRGLPVPAALPRLVEAGLLGRKSGRGFFLYPKAPSKGPRPVNDGVYAFLGGAVRKTIPPRDMADRLSLLMANEAVLCLAGGVVASARDGDVGAVLGLGFPPLRGGPFRHLDALGAAAAVARMNELAAAHGPRFTPAPLLASMAGDGRRFHTSVT